MSYVLCLQLKIPNNSKNMFFADTFSISRRNRLAADAIKVSSSADAAEAARGCVHRLWLDSLWGCAFSLERWTFFNSEARPRLQTPDGCYPNSWPNASNATGMLIGPPFLPPTRAEGPLSFGMGPDSLGPLAVARSAAPRRGVPLRLPEGAAPGHSERVPTADPHGSMGARIPAHPMVAPSPAGAVVRL